MSALIHRRGFLKKMGKTGLIWTLGGLTMPQLMARDEIVKITLLHTNDVHSRIEPFPKDGTWRAGMGGAAKRAALLRRIRTEEENVLLFDSGDIFQGTPYFTFFQGELEFKLMSEMDYDAATLGNHDFDAGLDGLIKQLPHAQFPFLTANYDFSDTSLTGKTRPYQVFIRAGVKIGVFGLGIELEGLVAESLYGNTRYVDPIATGNRVASQLKQEEKCDLVVCLSHLGFDYDYQKVSDIVLAKNSRNIDIILGGHTHTFMKVPLEVNDLSGQKVSINQVGWAGLIMGRYDLYFDRATGQICDECQPILIR